MMHFREIREIFNSIDWTVFETEIARNLRSKIDQFLTGDMENLIRIVPTHREYIETLLSANSEFSNAKDTENKVLAIATFVELLNIQKDNLSINMAVIFKEYCVFLKKISPFFDHFTIESRDELRVAHHSLIKTILDTLGNKYSFVVLSGSYASNLMYPLSDLDGYLLVDDKGKNDAGFKPEINLTLNVLSACNLRLNENILGYVNQYIHFDKFRSAARKIGINIDFPRESWDEQSDNVCSQIYEKIETLDRSYLTFNRFLQQYIQSILIGNPIDSPRFFENEIWGFLFEFGGGNYSAYSRFIENNNVQLAKLFSTLNWTEWMWREAEGQMSLLAEVNSTSQFEFRNKLRQQDMLLGLNLFRYVTGNTSPFVVTKPYAEIMMGMKIRTLEKAKEEIRNIKFKALAKDRTFQGGLKKLKYKIYQSEHGYNKILYQRLFDDFGSFVSANWPLDLLSNTLPNRIDALPTRSLR